MRGSEIMLAVPTRGRVHWQTLTRLQEVRDRTPGLGPIVYEAGNLSVARTRNLIVQRFLASGCGALAMVDDDVVPPPHMLEALGPLVPEYGMAAIPHPHPHPGDASTLVLSAYESDGACSYRPARLEDGANDVDAVATGCVLISREVLEVFGPSPFRVEHDPMVQVWSDDLLFCADLRALEYRICAWVDGWHCDHLSTVSLAPLHERSTREHV